MPKLDIVIVNWNAGNLLRECLESIHKTGKIGYELSKVIVVDNASSDDSLNDLDNLPLPLIIIVNSCNLGFGAACNTGADQSQADYLLFLNPDTRLYENSISEPVGFMESPDNQHVGICGIQLINKERKISQSCARFPRPVFFFNKILGLDKFGLKSIKSHFMYEWDHAESRYVDHVIGAFFLVRRLVFKRLKGFDERFFLYLEDLDFSYRLATTGMKSYYLATAKAYHKGGGTSEQIIAQRLFYSLYSRILYGFKHFRIHAAIALMLVTLTVEPVLRVLGALYEKSMKKTFQILEGYIMLWTNLPKLVSDCISIKK